MRSGRGYALGLICEHLGLLPSELMKRNPTITDMAFLSRYYNLKQEMTDERLNAMFKGVGGR